MERKKLLVVTTGCGTHLEFSATDAVFVAVTSAGPKPGVSGKCCMLLLLVQIIWGKLSPQKRMSKSTVSEDKYSLLSFHCSETEGSSKIKSCKAVVSSGACILLYMKINFINANQNLVKLYGNRQGIFGCPESDSENERQFQIHFEILI